GQAFHHPHHRARTLEVHRGGVGGLAEGHLESQVAAGDRLHCAPGALPHGTSRFRKEVTMARVILGNHSSVLVPRRDRESIRHFYCDVLGGTVTKADPERDFIRLGEDFYLVFLYGDVADASELVRSARAVWLEIKSDDVEEMRRKILDSGVRRLEVPDPHLYFQ